MDIMNIHNLVKHYPRVQAVDGVSFAVKSGACFGLLGPNGAGKTTTLEIVEGIIPKTSGEIFYKGAPRTKEFAQEVGIQFQSTALLSFLTVKETLTTFSRLYANPMDLDRLIALCQMEDILDQYNDKISGGQKQRLLLALALVNDPELVFLDEPTTGLDPQARRHVWDIVRSIKARGKTVVLTTHYMEEAEKLCDEIAIMDQGRIVVKGSPATLLMEHGRGVLATLPASSFSMDALTLANEEIQVRRKGENIQFRTKDIKMCLEKLLQAGVDLHSITVRSPNLEDLFLDLTGRRLRE
ncbi:MAG: ABC transporter ATP-binding protein [Desulfatibacillum sp.]|nr:ABC transporter ATP-binding protein [Desulfatibacillum sp.]